MKEKFKKAFTIIKETFLEWNDDNAWRLGAAMSFFTVLSLPGLLIISISVAGAMFGEEAVRGSLEGQIRDLMGPEGARAVQTMIENAHDPQQETLGAIVGIVTLLVGAAGVFVQLQEALNQIWGVRMRRNAGIMAIIKKRVLSFSMVLVVGFLLIVSLLLFTFISIFSDQLANLLPTDLLPLVQILNFVVTFAIITFTFAFMYKVMPDVRIKWKQVWTGAIVTAGLFMLGKFGIGIYLGNADVGSSYGAAGSLIVLLTWIFYSSLIVFFGAEFTQVFARHSGYHLEPSKDAVPVIEYYKNRPYRKATKGQDDGGDEEDYTDEDGEPIKPKKIRMKNARIIFRKK